MHSPGVGPLHICLLIFFFSKYLQLASAGLHDLAWCRQVGKLSHSKAVISEVHLKFRLELGTDFTPSNHPIRNTAIYNHRGSFPAQLCARVSLVGLEMNQAVKAISSGKTLDSYNYLNAFLLTMWETKSSQSHSLVNAKDKLTTWSFIWLGRRILLQYDYVTQNDLKKTKASLFQRANEC